MLSHRAPATGQGHPYRADPGLIEKKSDSVNADVFPAVACLKKPDVLAGYTDGCWNSKDKVNSINRREHFLITFLEF